MLGDRIRAARMVKGLSLRALAQQVGVSHQAIFKYETGKDIPSSQVILALARALDVKPEFFFRPTRPMEIVPAFRKRSCLPAKAERSIIGQIRESLERRLELEELTGEPARDDLSPFLKGMKQIESLEGVEAVAERLRDSWGLGIAPINNLVELLEDRGVRIQIVDEISPYFDACGFWVRTERQETTPTGDPQVGSCRIPVIAIRKGVPGDRQRFSLAHELGHLVFDDFSTGNTSSRALESGRRLDIEAVSNRFAGAFIVPRAAVLQELGSKRRNVSIAELYLLKHKYGLSIQAWLRRAQELGIISKKTESRLFRQLSAAGYRKVEPGDAIPFEEPTKARRLALRAVAEGIISRAKAAELLGVRLSEFMEEV
ncbi:MAG TPA: ImmA/IrrE family metallo-endopeptidase [Firmicutes bacterium]|nr:ImmA/IrrE family metallo-endopeptidase [Candidatus Fermentithermobacillaceae bacterium]